MTSLWKLLRGSCAIATSGALMLSSFPTLAQDQPPAAAQAPPLAAVQPPPQPAAQQLGQGALEKLLAPIALYPDDLVAQILTASTYPIEVVEASRWVSAHPNLHGDALENAMQQQPWDPSVKGLTAVSQVLSMMNDKLDWTQQLGGGGRQRSTRAPKRLAFRFEARSENRGVHGILKAVPHVRSTFIFDVHVEFARI